MYYKSYHCYICGAYIREKSSTVDKIEEICGVAFCPICSMRIQLLSTNKMMGLYDVYFLEADKQAREANRTFDAYLKNPNNIGCDKKILHKQINRARNKFEESKNNFINHIKNNISKMTLDALEKEIFMQGAKKRGYFLKSDIYKIFPFMKPKEIKEFIYDIDLSYSNFKNIYYEIKTRYRDM